MGNAEAVLYGADESIESAAMVALLTELGVDFEYRRVDHDPTARREFEQLDGETVPLLRMGSDSIVRGFDRIKVQQMFGWVGC
jgi:glutaredoxin